LLATALIAAMFRIVPNPTFTTDVPLSVPGSDTPVTIKITFRHKTRAQLAAYQQRAVELALQADAADAQEQFAAYVAEVVDGWIGVVGADDKALPYTPANLAQLVQAYPAAGAEIVRRYSQQLSHARAGN
jgi:hypothetical protein